MDDVHTDQKTMSDGLLSPMKNRSIVNRIIDRLTNAILSGDLKPGQRIPTETELSESMQVGRNSVREAVKALETMGVLDVRRAEGTFVAEGFSERMMAPMLYGMVLEGGNTYALVELRRLMEIGILSLAIEKATEQDVQRLHESLLRLEETAHGNPNPEALQDADIAFHEALLLCARNPLVDKMYAIIEKLSRPTRILAVMQFIEREELGDMVSLHKEFLRIVEDKDEQSIHQAIDLHFRYWTRKMQ